MVSKDRNKPTGSPKVHVGEIDTSAPFQSVKDAVNLFGEGAFSGEKPKYSYLDLISEGTGKGNTASLSSERAEQVEGSVEKCRNH